MGFNSSQREYRKIILLENNFHRLHSIVAEKFWIPMALLLLSKNSRSRRQSSSCQCKVSDSSISNSPSTPRVACQFLRMQNSEQKPAFSPSQPSNCKRLGAGIGSKQVLWFKRFEISAAKL